MNIAFLQTFQTLNSSDCLNFRDLLEGNRHQRKAINQIRLLKETASCEDFRRDSSTRFPLRLFDEFV